MLSPECFGFFCTTSGEMRTALPASRMKFSLFSKHLDSNKDETSKPKAKSGGSQARWAVCCRSQEVSLIHRSPRSGNLPFSWHCKSSKEGLSQRRSLKRWQFAKLKDLAGFKFQKQNCSDNFFPFCSFCLIIVQSQKYFSSLQSWQLTRLSKWAPAHRGMARNMLFFFRKLLIVLYCLPSY